MKELDKHKMVDKVLFKPNTYDELYEAVNEWYDNSKLSEEKYGHISNWNVSNITDMSYLFEGKIDFNEDISKWDTAKVKYMENMFYDAYSFNQDISNWNVSNVNNMSLMFVSASSFNQNINKWNTSNVKNMNHMFEESATVDLPDWYK